MLIRFTVENFLSFKDEIEFSMVSSRKTRHPSHIVKRERKSDLRLLKTGVLYGANASGKSNIISSMAFAKDMVLGGVPAGGNIPVQPFLLDSALEKNPSKFEFEFRVGQHDYIYSFELDKHRVHHEQLCKIKHNDEIKLFERTTSKEGLAKVSFSNNAGPASFDELFLAHVARSTRPEQLFINECIESNVSDFDVVESWFRNHLKIMFPGWTAYNKEIRFFNEPDFKARFRDLINLFDLHIHDIDLHEIDFDSDPRIPRQAKADLKRMILEQQPEGSVVGLLTVSQEPVPYYTTSVPFTVTENKDVRSLFFVTHHQADQGARTVGFDMTQESDGTRRLFDIVPGLIDLFEHGNQQVLVIDEIDRSLHAHQTYGLLELFLENTAYRPSQFIVTTHESGILDLDLLRPDEIWFIEKDGHGASALYSLEEFKPQYHSDIRSGYLHGRFGAIPILPSYNILDWAK
ncbi:MAG: AAA family ATPase [Chloroflexi bacterium]|nr:AAA family ATPase [Chloroflexota bacterium]